MKIERKLIKSNSKYILLGLFSLLVIVGITLTTIQINKFNDETRSHADTASLNVTGVQVNNSSVKVTFTPVSGAKDYRIYDVTNPNRVKYAGIAHKAAFNTNPDDWVLHFSMNPDGTPVYPYTLNPDSGPMTIDVPNTEIEWNTLTDGQAHTLVVQAVDALGPIPPANLYNNDTNLPLVSPLPQGAMLGSNSGATPDGKTSINGQGPTTNTPHVIAQSQPFVVTGNQSFTPFVGSPDAITQFVDTFDNSEASSMKNVVKDDWHQTATYSLNAGTPKAWDIYFQLADTMNSMPFISDGHFMDVLFDGGTPGTNNPLHQGHGVMAMSPEQTADISNGKMMHATMEVDFQQSLRRWVGFQFAPVSDPLTGFDEFDKINNTNTALFLQFFGAGSDGNSGSPNPENCTAEVFRGGSDGTSQRFWGGAGQTLDKYCDMKVNYGGPGRGLDNRVRFDVFFTQKYMALFEDGQLIQQGNIYGGLPFSQLKTYFVHYVYHTDNDITDLIDGFPYPAYNYWKQYYKRSDERHWDNMGFEVLPAAAVPSGDWSVLATRIHMPQPQAPTFVDASGVTTQPTISSASPTPSITLTKAPTATLVPATNTPVPPTATSTPNGTKFAATVLLHGIGKGGDVINPTSTGNTNPIHAQRSVTVDVYSLSNQLVTSKQGTVQYTAAAGNFQGIIDMGQLATGTYVVKIKSPQYLRNTIQGVVSVTQGQTVTLPSLALTAGDTNNDNILSILDYTVLLDCYSVLSPAKNCTDSTKQQLADLTDDGQVNEFDYNLWLRETSVVSGQ